ncbi:hypothetical protein PTTW11_06306 [Pyrenophora teres f. teres]|uniref:Uncharacterized protein n=1 Tax=Pyrenophora teres f. teres TaxID=97479 RepID=A0A6S6W404_9PLEO|nr:hypothetical protein PTTW11_06306 [Pyrenophora teres f. teres]
MPLETKHDPAESTPLTTYSSDGAGQLAEFLGLLHSPTGIAQRRCLEVRSVSFHLWYDSIGLSGIIELLQIRNARDTTEPPRERQLPGELGIAAMMFRSLSEQYRYKLSAIPIKAWWQVIMVLLRCCKNLEMIEVPAQWGHIRWYRGAYGGAFRCINHSTKRQVENGRWRWGREPLELEEADERKMDIE